MGQAFEEFLRFAEELQEEMVPGGCWASSGVRVCVPLSRELHMVAAVRAGQSCGCLARFCLAPVPSLLICLAC